MGFTFEKDYCIDQSSENVIKDRRPSEFETMQRLDL